MLRKKHCYWDSVDNLNHHTTVKAAQLRTSTVLLLNLAFVGFLN